MLPPLWTQYTYTSTPTSPCTDNLGVFLGHLALKPCSLLSIRRGIFYLPRAHTVKWISQYDISQIRQRDLHRIQTLLSRAKVFRHTLQDCNLSLINLFWLYSMLVILPKLNCTQAVSTLWIHYSEAGIQTASFQEFGALWHSAEQSHGTFGFRKLAICILKKTRNFIKIF